MNEFVEAISNPGVSGSRNALDEDEEEFQREQLKELDLAKAITLDLSTEAPTQLLLVASCEPATMFIRNAFGESSKKHTTLEKVGTVSLSLETKLEASFYTVKPGILLLEFEQSKDVLAMSNLFAAECAKRVFDVVNPTNVLVLDTILGTIYSDVEAEPPLTRIVVTRSARQDMSIDGTEVQFLEIGNLVRGFSAAFLAESEYRNLWGVLVLSLQSVVWQGTTLSGFLPGMDLVMAKAGFDTSIYSGDVEAVRQRCLSTREYVDPGRDMLYM